MKNIEKMNAHEMLRLLYKESRRIKEMKCPADINMVRDHTAKLETLDKRTIRIEAYAIATVVLVTLFVGIIGVREYFAYKILKDNKVAAVKDSHKKVASYNGIDPIYKE